MGVQVPVIRWAETLTITTSSTISRQLATNVLIHLPGPFMFSVEGSSSTTKTDGRAGRRWKKNLAF